MSNNAINERANYIQSPADDIESFFWVFFWAVLQNNTANHSERVRRCADMFKNGLRADAFLHYMRSEGGVLRNIVAEWDQVASHISILHLYFTDSLTALGKAGHFENTEEEARYWKLAWHILALEGVCMSLKTLLERFS